MPLVSDPNKRLRVIAIAIAVVTLVVVVYIAVSSVGTKSAVQATRDSVERTDCARRVNAEQVSARDTATLADRAVSRFYYRSLFQQAQGKVPGAEEVTQFGFLLQTADAADKVVADLPDPAKEVDRRCPD